MVMRRMSCRYFLSCSPYHTPEVSVNLSAKGEYISIFPTTTIYTYYMNCINTYYVINYHMQ